MLVSVGQAGSGRSLASFAAQLNTNDSPLDPVVEQTELDGTKVVVVRRQDGSELYVANTGDAYPLRANDKGKDAGQLDFTEYGADFHIVAPQGTVQLSELVWLDAVEKLSANMEKIFADIPTNLTPSVMAASASRSPGPPRNESRPWRSSADSLLRRASFRWPTP
jgi:hypothetical protein